jgi:FAD:protein FMN transferase
LFHRVRTNFGSFVSIEGGADDETCAPGALDGAFAAIEKIGALLHPTRGSDLCRLKEARLGESVHVDPWTYEILSACRDLHAASAGVFDPCLPGSVGRMPDLELAGDARVVKRADVVLDLGGIAKGFAVDRAIDALREHGCTYGLVNAGGDVRIFGPARREVLLRLPEGRVYRLELYDSAVAVSEPKSERSPPEHGGFYIGVTGERVAGRWVAVVAPTAMLADGLSKCAMLCPPEPAATLLRRHGAHALFDRASP